LGSEAELIFTLPAGYRPTKNRTFMLNYPGGDPVDITIDSDGDIKVLVPGILNVALNLSFAI